MNVVFTGDHHTMEVMKKVTEYLSAKSIPVESYGAVTKDTEVTLQEIIPIVVKRVQAGTADCGVLACGTGVGVEIGANRFKGVRASLCRDAAQAKNARIYDNANVLCLGSWYDDDLEAVLDAWFNNKFDGNEGRTQMLKDFDELDKP